MESGRQRRSERAAWKRGAEDEGELGVRETRVVWDMEVWWRSAWYLQRVCFKEAVSGLVSNKATSLD